MDAEAHDAEHVEDVHEEAGAERPVRDHDVNHHAEAPAHVRAINRAAERPQPEAPAPEPEHAEAREPESTRRRSTVREPAPIGFVAERSAEPVEAAPPEPPQPVVISPTERDEADRPRRSGWWSRKVLGKD